MNNSADNIRGQLEHFTNKLPAVEHASFAGDPFLDAVRRAGHWSHALPDFMRPLEGDAKQLLEKSGGGGNDGRMEARVARLEASVEHIESDVREIKGDLRSINANLTSFNSEVNKEFRDLRLEIGSATWKILGVFGAGFVVLIGLILAK